MAWDARYVVPANLGFPIFLVLLAYGLWKLGAQHHIVGPSGWHALGDTNYAAIWRAFSLANGQMIFQGLLATDYGRFADRNIRYRGTASIMLATAVSQITALNSKSGRSYETPALSTRVESRRRVVL
jgi:hypothetical protein